MSNTVDNPFFARLWMFMSRHETEAIQRLRRENLAGLTGRVLEVGAGTGTNFEFYPDTVTEVVAVEPERRLAEQAQRAAAAAAVPVTVTSDTVEHYAVGAEPFDAVVCSLVLCSVDEPETVLRQLHSLLRPGGELRYLEHIASTGARARMQKLADATLWPRLFGNCHTHRYTEQSIAGAGFQVSGARREWTLPSWAPIPVAEFALGRAVK
ncbi:class I SAM-dependent methyltransferase [Mycolicibacterium holsaticum]|jgi:2-polyprenyl-3-methyl-5-hydroxy-6-metoxy-1,4-benzoquinol methylase|uniref:class I SAM-dependent methyltransferase n=1 Tax=Mycolicibacterium holsaticum TaxID=152142 RepID=UPI001C7D9215|nr:class I SAM-dependent methyltransferase [Mycolicibacterium holsaticum]MDA4105905.1 phosphatidylethanolamine N-methyltransferase [Mycolicibacterium holsaticum DSM 44478 = JCM 12374]QZA13748.1 class I SAM-dependent methyltransferase [Mycolicibacterium holsaticum DSM 44478 = JCM 12374]UNC08790.1 class I SAM-dependent methyltransferase [Mycolicibacterium holsaticum DSM 44478 = JCM 12374]